jgi:uncharacterized protein YneF (UPF0154 family)
MIRTTIFDSEPYMIPIAIALVLFAFVMGLYFGGNFEQMRIEKKCLTENQLMIHSQVRDLCKERVR